MTKLRFSKKKAEKKIEIDGSYKILIVDDDSEVHTITKIALEDLNYNKKSLEFLSAYSAKEGYEILSNHKDIAIVLLDVIMESDEAGLELAKKIRDELKNKKVRIILRTGQPGIAPQKDVILNYDINDYKEKTELTAEKLFTSVVSALRSYDELDRLEVNIDRLRYITTGAIKLFGHHSESEFLLSARDIVSNSIKKDILFCSGYDDEITHRFGKQALIDKLKSYVCENGVCEKIDDGGDDFIGYSCDNMGNFIYMIVEGIKDFDEIKKQILRVAFNNISMGYHNNKLYEKLIESEREVIYKLSDALEVRSEETGGHVERVAQISYILAKEYGLSESEAQKIRLASPMHDIGKIGIPDAILMKPGKLTDEEFEIMKTHTTIGYEILKDSDKEVLKAASIIAYEHHEKWDGTGYPRGLKGDDIHIYGRITSVADVFDALTHKRVYKEAFSIDEVVKFYENESGKMFDPKLVQILLDNLDKIKSVDRI